MIKDKKITVVIPCRNEEDAIRVVLQKKPKEIDEILVVDNLSTDKTREVAESLGAKVIVEPRTFKGCGYGYALANGINSAQGDIIACLDGDDSYPIKDIPKIARYLLNKNVDFISCNRVIHDPKKRSHIRAFGVKFLNFFMWLVYGYPIKDSLTGMWVFRKDILSELPLYEGGWDFSEEIKLSALMSDTIRFTEYGVPHQDRVFNQSKINLFQAGMRYFVFLFKYKYLIRRNVFENLNLSLLPAYVKAESLQTPLEAEVL